MPFGADGLAHEIARFAVADGEVKAEPFSLIAIAEGVEGGAAHARDVLVKECALAGRHVAVVELLH